MSGARPQSWIVTVDGSGHVTAKSELDGAWLIVQCLSLRTAIATVRPFLPSETKTPPLGLAQQDWLTKIRATTYELVALGFRRTSIPSTYKFNAKCAS